MRVAVHGHMGRDEAMVDNFVAHGHTVDVIGGWENPGLVDKVAESGGRIATIRSIDDVHGVSRFVDEVQPDMFITHFDDALVAGVADAVNERSPGVLLPIPNEQQARVEGDKHLPRAILREIAPDLNPDSREVTEASDVDAAIQYFADSKKPVAVKPREPTGGKGVKVQGKHFESHEEAAKYAHRVLETDGQTGVEIQERIDDPEFTLQILTDGKTLVRPPVTYDYPYREDGDTGPGTGGMGTFSVRPGENLPFTVDADIDEAMDVTSRVLQHPELEGYKGVIYPTFFKTSDGIKLVEFNARGGDPEFINVMDSLDPSVDMAEVYASIAQGELGPNDIRFQDVASTLLYLVAPEYGYGKTGPYTFTLDTEIAKDLGVNVRFAAAERMEGNQYQTVGTSRTVGLSALGSTPWEARAKIDTAISESFGADLPLVSRNDVGNQDYINRTTQQRSPLS